MFSSRLVFLFFASITLALGLVSATPTPDKQPASALAVLTNCQASTDPILAQISMLPAPIPCDFEFDGVIQMSW